MNKQLRHYATLAILATAVVVGIVLGYPEIIKALTHNPPVEDPGIPTSFSGNRLAYGFAFFSLFSASTIGIRQLLIIAWQLHEESWRMDPDVGLFRMTLGACWLAILLGAAPDVLVLLLWGEAGDRTMSTVMTFNRICDGLVIIPVIAATFIRVRADQFRRTPSISELQVLAPHVDIRLHHRAFFIVSPRAETIADNAKIVAIILIMAAGLVAFK